MDWDLFFQEIPGVIEKIRASRVLNNMTIRDDIFGILEKHCNVIYYPLSDEKNSGFHTKRYIKDRLEDVVYINTAKTIAEQVFTAAHELGHVWNVAKQVAENAGFDGAITEEIEEKIVNRFAAELLMPEEVFVPTFMAHMAEVGEDSGSLRIEDLVKVIVMQMNDYMVPYESVRRRMVETRIISPKTGEFLKKIETDILALVVTFSKEQNTILDRITEKKTIPGLRDLVEKVERENLLDEYSVCKIKKDFDLGEINVANEEVPILVEGDGVGDGED